jgi:hypothetical protein
MVPSMQSLAYTSRSMVKTIFSLKGLGLFMAALSALGGFHRELPLALGCAIVSAGALIAHALHRRDAS